MNKRRGTEITRREAAQLRLAQWATVLRAMFQRGAPNANYYNQQGFLNGRIDPDALRRFIEQDERFEAAMETGEWMDELQESAPSTYAALYVRYVERQPGTSRALEGQDQVAIFKQRTGLKKSRFYELILAGERYIGLRIGPISSAKRRNAA